MIGANSIVMAGPIAYWSGNGNANDSVGGHNGTLVGGASYGAGFGGQQAFLLNGSNGYVSVPDSTAWDFGTNSFRIDVWANFNSISNRSFAQTGNVLIGHDDGSGSTNKWFFSYLSTGQLGFHINSSPSGPADFLTSPTAAPVSTGSWNEFSVTRFGSTYTFYENGVSLGSVTDANYGSIPIATQSLTIGQAEGQGWFNGSLEDIQISSPAPVPEPTSFMLLVVGGIGAAVAGYGRRKLAAD